MINNIASGRQFGRAVRALLARDSSAADSRDWYALDHMLDGAEAFGICAVFNSDRDHWRLVLKINDDGTLKVYDPLYSQEGSHIYDYRNPEGAVSMPSRDLQKLKGIAAAELFGTEMHRLALLRQRAYALHLPANFRNEGLQDDGHNCGPLVLYAAMVGNKYTAEFTNKPDFSRLKQMSGIEIL